MFFHCHFATRGIVPRSIIVRDIFAHSLRVLRTIGSVTAIACLVGGCVSGLADNLSDRMPQSMGGLPEGAPARPATPYQYPAVNSMPASRPDKPLSEEDQVKLEKDLARIRDQQAGREEQTGAKGAAAGAKPGAPAKKGPPDAKGAQNTGASTNP